MTTDELVRLIEQDAARHRHCPADVRLTDHYPAGCIVTYGSLVTLSGIARRHLEDAVQQARLEGVPIITAGGFRIAQTAEDADSLADWLDARMDTQRRTRDAVRAKAFEMSRAAPPREAAGQASLWSIAA